jgi:predicted TPR repeat methyltransferase
MQQVHDLLSNARQAHLAGNRAAAIEIYREIVGLEPGNLDGNYLLGSLLAEAGILDEAERYLKVAAEILPSSPYVWNNLGNVYLLRGDEDAALSAWAQALAVQPNLAEAWSNMGLIHHRRGHLDLAEECMKRSTALRDTPYAWSVLAAIAEKKGRRDEAAAICRMILQNVPDHAESRFMLSRLDGAPMSRTPEDMVRSMFDGYAKRFDRHLVEELQYRTPEQVGTMIDRHLRGRTFENVADLGCGTGLMGTVIGPRSRSIVGVDLSPKMLEVAATRSLYRRLVESEIVNFLHSDGDRFDLIIAADVLVYLGDLAPLFAAAARATASPAWFALSTERTAPDEPGDWVLRSTGRYAHSLGYLQRCCSASGWAVVDLDEAVLRNDASGPVLGNIILLTKQ